MAEIRTATQDDLDEAVKSGKARRREVEEATQKLNVQLAKLNAESDSAKRACRVRCPLGRE